mgnify:CR=1 FL=1
MATSNIKKPIGINYYESSVTNDHDYYVYQIGHLVVVSGTITGTGTGGYISTLIPAIAKGDVIFEARCISGTQAGTIINMRTGSNGTQIYREQTMASGSIWEFSFSYVAANEV